MTVLLTSHPASAQDELRARCRAAAAPEATRAFCELATYAAENIHARVGIAGAAGNPVPGTASTFGLRLGPLPRMSLAGRFTVVRLELPPIEQRGSSETPDGLMTSFAADASVGLFPGFPVAPTIGGFLSIDLLGSAGRVGVPDADGLNGGAAHTWAAGARLGIMRESFTAPGISVSAMYRKHNEVVVGDAPLADADAFVHVDDFRAYNLRAAIGKRVSVLALTGGVGYDALAGDVLLRIDNPNGGLIEVEEDDFATERWTAFANASLTMLILSLVGEVGWQQGGDTPGGAASGADVSGKSAIYASIALRLAI